MRTISHSNCRGLKPAAIKAIGVLCFVCSFSFLVFSSSAQLPSPLDAPLIISGSFGEPRDGHYHTGVDFTTRKKTGVDVFAVQDGFVSRIKVSSVGYGKALYVTHPDGTMSVYGHLSKFNDAIQRYVTDEEYRAEKFEVELYPDKAKFRVKQGDVIAYSGNSGGSSAPHLHFEIRDASGESFPLNPLAYKLPVRDTIPPVLSRLVLYDRSDSLEDLLATYPLPKRQSDRGIRDTTTDEYRISASKVGIGIEASDLANGCDPDGDFGVYSASVSVDGVQTYSFSMDRLDFAEGKSGNAFIDYASLKRSKHKYYRLYKLPNNNSSIGQADANRGVVDLSDKRLHHVAVTCKDFNGNATTYAFDIANASSDSTEPVVAKSDKSFVARYDKPLTVGNDTCKATFDTGTFFDNAEMYWYKTSDAKDTDLSDSYRIANRFTPLNKPFTLSLLPNKTISEKLRSKLVVVNLDNNATTVSAWSNGLVVARPRDMGLFVLKLDTVAPRVVPQNFKANGKGASQPKLLIADARAGLKDYDIYTDGAWTLADYDAKSDSVTVLFKQKPSAGVHQLKVVVTDAVGNKKTYTYKLTY